MSMTLGLHEESVLTRATLVTKGCYPQNGRHLVTTSRTPWARMLSTESPEMGQKARRIDLVQVAEHLEHQEGVDHGVLVFWICDTFTCRERTAKDLVSVLIRGGWAESVADQADRRLRTYRLTAGGREDLSTDIGRRAIRAGRRKFSTCSTRARRVRRHQERNGLVEYARALWIDQQEQYRALAGS
jgi:DNA-binding MarR family transcriptional regulator